MKGKEKADPKKNRENFEQRNKSETHSYEETI